MDNIIVISQNVKIPSLSCLTEFVKPGRETLIISTQLIFENEAEQIDNVLGCKCTYLNFSDLMTDAELEACDVDAFHPDEVQCDTNPYYQDIKILKNERIIKKIDAQYPAQNKIVVCDDLGIHLDSWLKDGYKKIDCEYYFARQASPNITEKRVITWRHKFKGSKIYRFISGVKNVIKHVLTDKHLSVAYLGGRKYVFWGSLNRIAYRLQLSFKPASRMEYLRAYVDRFVNTQPDTIRLSTLHEGHNKWKDVKGLNVRLLQDGYLPPNYGSNYLYFYGRNTIFYTWDTIGKLIFQHFHLPSEVCPFRKKLYLPKPIFPTKVKKVLVATSGAGDWTAIKNRSDEDKMLQVFGQIAKLFPDVEIVYRCHPVWINPEYQGVNSINRAAEYIAWLNVPNMHISANIPNPHESTGFRHSFSRNSFNEDLKDVDVVFGEHSVAMLDGGFKGKIFCSVNVTGRRNLFKGITDLGFPHCESLEQITSFIKSLPSDNFINSYKLAIDNYNKMTDQE